MAIQLNREQRRQQNKKQRGVEKIDLVKKYFDTGFCYSQEGKFNLAIAEFTKLIKLNIDRGMNAVVYSIRGICYSDMKEYDLALADYNQALALNDKDAEAYLNRGACYREMGDYQAALADYNQALALNDKDAEAYLNRGACYREMGDYQAALADYNQSIALNDKDATAYNNRGICYSDMKEYDLALADYNQALALNDKDAEAYLNRGACYSEMGDYQAALADYNQALALNDKDAEAYLNRGACYSEMGDYQAALADYNQALTLNDKYAEAYYNRGNCYSKMGDHQAALTDYNQALALNDKYAEAYYNRGICYSKMGDYQAALADFNQSIALNDKDAEAYLNRGFCYAKIKEYDLALTDYNQALTLNDKDVNASAYNNRGICYHHEMGDYQAALTDYNQALALNDKNAAVYVNRGACYREMGDYQAALTDYNQALALNDKDVNAGAYYNRGICYRKMGDYQAALTDYNQALALNDKNAAVYVNRGACYREMGDYQAELTDYNQALALNDKDVNAGAYYNRGICYSEMGDYDLARDSFKKGIECTALKDKKDGYLLASNVFLSKKQYQDARYYVTKAFQFADSNEQQYKHIYLENIDNAEKLEETNQQLQIELADKIRLNQELEQAKKQLEDMMAMFAHKFRAPLDAIIYNVDHANIIKIYNEAAQTMRGLLDVFSVISTDAKILQDKLLEDKQGNSNLIKLFSKTLDMMLLHLLSVSGREKIRQHYFFYAKAQKLCDSNVDRKQWRKKYFKLEQQIQEKWEQDFAQLLNRSPSLTERLEWVAQHFFAIELRNFDRNDVIFAEYGTVESLLTILLNEILVNAFKYYSSETQQAVVVELQERGENQVIICCNPSNESERDISKGSFKGHSFLATLARKIGSDFTKPIPQDNFVMEFSIPSKFLVKQ